MFQTFFPLVSIVDTPSQLQPVEFLLDRELAFKDYKQLKPFQVREYVAAFFCNLLRNAIVRLLMNHSRTCKKDEGIVSDAGRGQWY